MVSMSFIKLLKFVYSSFNKTLDDFMGKWIQMNIALGPSRDIYNLN